MFNLPPPKNGFTTHFHCIACGHNFRRDMRRIYIDLPTFRQQIKDKKAGGRSPYVIPQRIACPKCGKVDQYELMPETLSMLSLTLIANAIGGGLQPDHPVRQITYALHDGTPIHPLDAVEHYRSKVANDPDNLSTRMRFGNVLRALGSLDEAEAQYQFILERDDTQLEAWKSLASIQIARKHPGAAKKALRELVAHAPQCSMPDRENWSDEAQDYLDGISPLDDLSPDALFLANKIEPKNAVPKIQPRRHKKRRR